MLELIAIAMTTVAAVGGYVQSRRFTRERLRNVDAVQKPGVPLVVGAAAAVAAAPVAWLIPLIGGGTALLFGAGVGAGLAAGRRDARLRLPAGD